MTSEEKILEDLDTDFVNNADAVFHEAYNRALAAGLSVLVVKDETLYEVFPDGRREKRGDVKKSTPHRIGSTVKLG